MRASLLLGAAVVLAASAHAQLRPRERDLALPIGGTAGPLDAITDVAGVPVGEEIPDLLSCIASSDPTVRPRTPRCGAAAPPARDDHADADAGAGSIIIVVATDAPLLPHQLKRLVTRAAPGVGRMGGKGENSSGDIFVAFSTANPGVAADTGVARVAMLPNARVNPLFHATVQATEAAIVDALLAADTMTGVDDLRVFALPRDRLLAPMRKYGRAP